MNEDVPKFNPDDEKRWKKAYEKAYTGILRLILADKLREVDATLSDRGIWSILDKLTTKEALLNLAKERKIFLTKKDFDNANQLALQLVQRELDNYPDDDVYELE